MCSLSFSLSVCLCCVFQRGSLTQIPVVKETRVESGQFLLLSVLCMLFILVALAVSATFFCVRQRSHLRMKEKLASLGTDTSTDATATYQVRPVPFTSLWANQEAGTLCPCSAIGRTHTLFGYGRFFWLVCECVFVNVSMLELFSPTSFECFFLAFLMQLHFRNHIFVLISIIYMLLISCIFDFLLQ